MNWTQGKNINYKKRTIILVFKKILVIQTAFIGDAILASSVIEKLNIRFPLAEISVLVRKGNEGLYTNHPFVKNVFVWDKTTHKTKNLFKLLKTIRKQKFNFVINCHRHASSGILAGLSGAQYIVGFKQNPFSFLFHYAVKHFIGDGRHEVDRYNELLQEISDEKVFKPKLYPTPSNYSKVEDYKKNTYVCMAPSSVWLTKQLPLEKWVELCNIVDTGKSIYLIGADTDAAMCDYIIATAKHPYITNLAGKLNFLDACALIKDAEMNYVNDSAPLHLASAMNAPVTAYFCSTVPAFGFTPLSDKNYIVEVDEKLNCRPCGLHGFKVCPKEHFKCGLKIKIENKI